MVVAVVQQVKVSNLGMLPIIINAFRKPISFAAKLSAWLACVEKGRFVLKKRNLS
jgi:hypothetical protein